MQQDKRKIKILLLSAPIGSGHVLAAEALREAFSSYEDVEIVHGNVFNFFPAIIGKVFLKTYLKILQSCPFVYEFAYKWGNSKDSSLSLRNFLNNLLSRLGEKYIRSVSPDAVLATHATPVGIISAYKKRNNIKLFLGAVVTDFTVHKWWLNENTSTYFLANELLRDKITVPVHAECFGIPIRNCFKSLDKNTAREKYGICKKDKVCLLLGGGEGLLPMESIVKRLAEKNKKLRIIAVTGHNKKLAQNLNAMKSADIMVLGFTDDLPMLLSAADVVVTKAGGLSAAEILAVGCSYIIFNPLPGQEENNARFLQKHCGAMIAKDTADIDDYVSQIINKQDKEDKIKHCFAKPHAAEDICRYVLNTVTETK